MNYNIKELLSKKFENSNKANLLANINNKNIVVWGTGSSFHYFHEIFILKFKIKPVLFIDKNFKLDDTFLGTQACTFDHLNYFINNLDDLVLIICIRNKEAFSQMREEALNKGFKYIFSLFDFYEINNPFDLPKTKFSFNDYILKKSTHIVKAFDYLSDSKSKEIFYKVLKTHLYKKNFVIPSELSTQQFFSNNFVKRIDYSNIICGGGDDVLRFAPYIKNSMSSLLMFDPHPSQIKRYSFMFKKKSVKSMFKNLCLLPLALHNSNSVVNFSVSQFQRNRFSLSSGYGAMISSSGTLQVHSIKLDSIAMGFKPTFIALDIEGSELNALKGSKGIIKRFSPSLSIALYHSINHLWEIVIFLKKVNPNYNFYIRNYSSFCGETFLYAVDTR